MPSLFQRLRARLSKTYKAKLNAKTARKAFLAEKNVERTQHRAEMNAYLKKYYEEHPNEKRKKLADGAMGANEPAWGGKSRPTRRNRK